MALLAHKQAFVAGRAASRPAVAVSRVQQRGTRLIARAGASKAIDVDDSAWGEMVLSSSLPVLVDFWAPWCGPCRMIAPIVDELAGEYAGRLTCVKVNTDDAPGIATECGIRSIPTVLIYKDGKKCDTIIGAVPKATIVKSIEKYL
ncbi:MAG: thioredoxin M-type, chloroplastic [Monoraphidium minutum]|nr:MAG: thioredoxin M-type, chloroplastic [Monoraphidium minutum]